MANQILSMNKLHLVLRLLNNGKSGRYISHRAEISRKSVDKYVSVFNTHPLSLLELCKLDDYDLQVIVKSGLPSPEYVIRSNCYPIRKIDGTTVIKNITIKFNSIYPQVYL